MSLVCILKIQLLVFLFFFLFMLCFSNNKLCIKLVLIFFMEVGLRSDIFKNNLYPLVTASSGVNKRYLICLFYINMLLSNVNKR